MVIHYLQCGCNPPVLPCLQKMMPDVFKPTSDVKNLDLLHPLPEFLSRNEQPLGDLLLGFLYYFSYLFRFAVQVISVRLGCTIDKDTARNYVNNKNTPTQWRWICIEEPFDRTNTARSVWDEQSFSHILNVFRYSHYKLEKSKNLNSILNWRRRRSHVAVICMLKMMIPKRDEGEMLRYVTLCYVIILHDCDSCRVYQITLIPWFQNINSSRNNSSGSNSKPNWCAIKPAATRSMPLSLLLSVRKQ